jgi:S1-C subfamily serine protease
MTEPWYGQVPEPPRTRVHSRFLTFTLVAVLAAAAGAGGVIALRGNPSAPHASPGTAGPTQGSPRPVSPGTVSPGTVSPGTVSPGTVSPGTGTPGAAAGTGSQGSQAGAGASAIPVPPASAPPAANGKLDAQAVANEVQPGMVNISAPAAYASALSAGTGIVLSANGLVLTNNHVIRGTTAPTATLVDSGKAYKATILGYDAANDVALLHLIGASGLTPVTVGNSDAVRVGQAVLGLGNAQGQGGQPTVAAGQVTALNQTIRPQDSSTGTSETLRGTIQTSAQIQEGDSGGPLASAAGEVIGMNTAATTTQSLNGGTATAGYAIPINAALRIARQIAAGQSSATVRIGLPPFMGISVADASTGCPASGFGGFSPGGTAAAPAISSGALICGVYSGTPAKHAGLAAGDVIISANGKGVSGAAGLISITAGLRPGTAMSLKYVNANGATQSATVALIEGPAK